MARATKARGSARKQALSRPASFALGSTVARLDAAIEACWLAAVLLVPLIVLPEQSFLSFTSVPKVFVLRLVGGAALILLIVRLALAATGPPAARNRRPQAPVRSASTAWRDLTRNPVSATVSAVAAVVAATALSAALSLSPYLSVWGKDPGSDGYGLYNVVCYAALALAVATTLRRRAQLWRLLAAVTATGTAAGLVAVLQNYGFAPLDISATSGARVTGTAGNPIFLGSLLVLTLPVSLATLIAFGPRPGGRVRWWAIAVPVITVQIAALAFTLSRGPWVGAALSLPVFLALVWLSGGRRTALQATALILTAVLLTVAALYAPSWSADDTGPVQAIQQRAEGGVSGESVVQRAATVDDEISQGLSGRIERWKASASLASERPQVVEGTDPGWFARTLAGYGPDMFRFAFPLKAPAELAIFRTDAAHNDHINRLVELGLTGSLAYVALGAAVIASISVLLSAARRQANAAAAVVAAGLAAALVARVVEQAFGIAKPGDLTIVWVLAGVAASAPAALGLMPAADSTERASVARTAGRRGDQPMSPRPMWALPMVLAPAAVVLVVVLVFVTWTKGVNYLLADYTAARTVESFKSDAGAGLRQIEEAIALASDVRDYHHRRSLMLQAIADADASMSQTLLREAAAADARAVELNPMSIDSNLAAAYSAWRVARTGDPAMALEALATYERLSALTPQNELVQSRLESLRSVVKVSPANTPP